MTKALRDIFVIPCFVLVIVYSLLEVHVASAGERVFMWKVESPQATAYVLGTVHMMKQELYPLDSRIDNAFKRADAYALEFNIEDVTRIQMDNMLADSSYAGDDNIKKHISEETYYALKQRLAEYGFPVEYMMKFRPWFLAITIETLEYQKLGLDPQYGIDKHFLKMAEGNKPIIELESLDSQMDFFKTMTEKDQELFLVYTMHGIDASAKNLDIMLRAWSDGNSNTLEKLMFDPLRENRQLSGIYEKLFYERNRKMTDKIEQMLTRKGTYFIAVGAAHLVGSQGIIQLLTLKGYAVMQQ